MGKLYQERGSVTLVNNTMKTLDLTVPNGKKWLVHGIMMYNGDDVARDFFVHVLDGSGNKLHSVGAVLNVSSGQCRELMGYVTTACAETPTPFPFPIKAGNKLRLTWDAGGTSSGGTAYYCITYEEMTE